MKKATRLNRWWAAAFLLPALLLGRTAQADFIPYENVTATQQSMTLAGYTRNVVILKPTSGTTGKVPALIWLDYRGGDPIDFADLSNVGRLVRDQGVWVIIPEAGQQQKLFGSEQDWNYEQKSQYNNDVAFLNALVAQVIANDPVDPKRIFMGGYSSGGGMTETMICANPGQLAGAAVVGAKLTDGMADNCKGSVGVPLIMFAGTADGSSKYNSQLGALSVPQSAQTLAQMSGCSTTPTTTTIPNTINDNTGTTVSLGVYGNCSSYGGVSLYTINNGGHTWPGTLDYTPPLGLTTQQIDATTLIWQFFSPLSRP